MVRVLGIDPGTKSYDFCGLEDDKLFLDASIPTIDVNQNPELLINLLKNNSPLDAIVGPSGYGLPVSHISEIDETKLFLMTLRPSFKKDSTFGLRRIINLLKKEKFNVYFIPGVIHLPTVPSYRKVNRIDMGTADKLCSAVLGVFDQANYYNISYDQVSFVLVEMGYGYNAIIGVKNGKIVDGIGGTSGGIGFLSMGAIDGEIACLLKKIDKSTILKGGLAYIAKDGKITPEEIVTYKDNERCKMAWNIFLEGIEKGIAQMKISVENPREILLSGRLCKIKHLLSGISERIDHLGKVRSVKGFAEIGKEAAQGAALIANSLAGGQHKKLINHMKIKQAQNNIFDYIFLNEICELKNNIQNI